MQTRPLGSTGLSLPILSFGASSLGQEFRSVNLDEALASVRTALDCGLNFIDTSPFYGRGMSEVLLGIALRGVPRESYTLCTKLGVTGCLVKPEAFTLLAGEDALSCYSWGSEVSRRFFCKRCGVHCFGRGELEFLGGAFVGVSVNCLDALDVEALPLRYWDGRHDNWEAGPRDTPWPVAGSERERDGRGA